MAKIHLALLLPLALGACDVGVVGEAKEAVKRQMLDEGSAKFRDVRRCDNDPQIVSGQVKGKNAFGAYTGFKSFHYVDGLVRMDLDPGPEYAGIMRRCLGDEIANKAIASTREAMRKHGIELDADLAPAAPTSTP